MPSIYIMPYICEHIVSLIKNSAEASSRSISVFINESVDTDEFEIIVADNGIGMTDVQVRRAVNPFFSSKGKKTGLGLSLFNLSVIQSGGELFITSSPGYGAVIRAVIPRSSLNRAPLGNIAACFKTVLSDYPNINFIYEHRIDRRGFYIDCGQLGESLCRRGMSHSQIVNDIYNRIIDSERMLSYLNSSVR